MGRVLAVEGRAPSEAELLPNPLLAACKVREDMCTVSFVGFPCVSSQVLNRMRSTHFVRIILRLARNFQAGKKLSLL